MSRTAAPTRFPAPALPGRALARRSRRSGRDRSGPAGSGVRTGSLPARTALMDEDRAADPGSRFT